MGCTRGSTISNSGPESQNDVINGGGKGEREKERERERDRDKERKRKERVETWKIQEKRRKEFGFEIIILSVLSHNNR